MTFQELKTLAWILIPRSDSTAAIYASEDNVREAIRQAADELQKYFTPPDAERPISREDALALELVTILEAYGRSGVLAARIVVDRYGVHEE